ncbi:MAG: L,D-transpeptidase family protein, partial [Acidobacteria bacterium]|nr:L,D-transpeptidase family protein [Acidobacteriota bacterium]
PNDWAKDAKPAKPGDPHNPMRVVKIFFKQPDYYIHGTNRPETLGTAASHGCIRMSETDVLVLGKMVMEHSGESRSPSWFRRILTRDTSDTVYLGKPVSIEIARELDIDSSPGYEELRREIPIVIEEPVDQ